MYEIVENFHFHKKQVPTVIEIREIVSQSWLLILQQKHRALLDFIKKIGKTSYHNN